MTFMSGGRIATVSSERLRYLVANCDSRADVLRELGLRAAGGNFAALRRRLLAESIDTSHFDLKKIHRASLLGKTRKPALEDVLVRDSTYRRSSLKRRLLSEGIITERCAKCGLGPKWQGMPLVLVLDHVNGVSNDNRLSNLRLLCPNCNSQTKTFAGRNRVRRTRKCADCGEAISRRSVRCRVCANTRRRGKYAIQWPDIEELQERLTRKSFCQVARELGVSDNAIRKHLRRAAQYSGE